MPDLNSPPIAPSIASRPDLDWSQVRETILMLNLSMTQIEMALHDSSSSVGELTDSFTSISGALDAIQQVAGYLPDVPEIQSAKTEIALLGSEVSNKVGQAIVAFQFYDRLSQRLSQVCRNLDDLGVLVNDPVRLYNPYAWVALQQKIRSKYVTEDDKHMFDTLMETRDVQKALAEFMKRKREQQPDGDIELF
ncbi:hypothetical protein [Gallionella capsiferriformans]|jgi:hypothetical protein|uniref:Uncharacterized protein n=1 Tax=Gallionella capsiferriformans (strain ES-2) TaxID=395494 RepID=D9SHJ4_GALCS|nr:hypothetical protein [Gallionella capsiferriformans]ADL55991.1 hypothetical protein Galf_1985 [Gallionella capsiferriformans ES-2]